MTDIGIDGEGYVKFWVDEVPESPRVDPDVQQMFAGQNITDPIYHSHASPVAATPTFGDQSPQPED